MKLKLTNTLIIARITYAIQIWGACTITRVKKVQGVHNSAARYVLKKSRRTLVNVLLTECSWLLVQLLIVYHSLLLMWKMIRNDHPLNILLMFMYWPGDYLSTEPKMKLITKASCGQRSVLWWITMPPYLRVEQNFR